MSTTTDKLALFKYDPSTDGAQTFNIKQALNDNWDKLDDAVKQILITLANKAPATHAAQHAKGGADPITPESIGAAPGGFGWGNQLDFVQSRDGVTTYADFCGMIDGVVDTMPVNTAKLIVARGPTGTGQYYGAHNMLAILNVGDTSASVTLTGLVPGLNSQGSRWHMVKAGGTWGDPEWVNPPMDLNTEYRTTERYMGKPVYAKLVNCEALPNAGYKTVSVGVSGLEKVIDVSGCVIDAHNDDFYSIPATNFSSSVHNVGLYVTGSQAIAISTQSDRSSYNAYVKVKYTKTTD